ncbi:hypothetical protein RhiirA4_476972 [Rhizophagus irregularis]|uniref:Uncharacterized protein n=1 Tax=Rhizophagus irregularis TaxID=588596 RepID=A0A2I1HCK0_9GLOM|nr:hypothetical protein RhiirA4_476972 [Rhizophagus irregularis]
MASSSKTNISQALSKGDDLDIAVNRALYFEPVSHALEKYSSFGLTEEDIARTVEKSTGDSLLYTELLMKHQEALSTFSIADLQSLYHFLFIFYESFDFIQASVSKGMENACKEFVKQQMTSAKQIPDTFEFVEDQLMEIEILEAPKTPKHQSKAAAQHKEPISILSAKATPYTSRGKQKRVSYADMVKQDPKDDVSIPNSPSPLEKKRKTAPISKAYNSQSSFKTTKKQLVAPSPKTISTIMTGYVPANKDLIQEITVYNIPSTWSQLDTLNHLKAWGQVVAIKFKSQQKYITIIVSIKLNQVVKRLWNEGVWTAPLGGLPERFQAVLKGVPASVTTATLYMDNPAHSILTDLEMVIGKPFSLDEYTGNWIRYFTPNLKQRRRNPQKSSKKHKMAKEIKNIDKALGGIDKLTTLAEIRSMLRKLGVS